MIKVIVGSTNPVKIKCVQDAFQQMMPESDLEVVGEHAPSGVRDQPMSDEETFQGAQNRASNVREHFPDANYWVGIEGGTEIHEQDMEAFAWVVILDQNNLGKARTASFVLPAIVKELVESGVELGHANDQVFKKHNSKQHNGAVGILTNDVVERKDYYQHAAVLALIPFLNRELY